MAGITLEQAETHLTNARTAYEKALNSQEYSIAGRTLKRASLKDLLDSVKYWEKTVKKLSGTSGMRVRGATISHEI